MADLPEQAGINAFGKAVRRYRKTQGLTMQQLANIAEIELSQVSRIETGKINPKLSTIIILSKALKVALPDLLKI